jgi:hypothetical protein
LLEAAGIGDDLLSKVVMLDVDVFCTFGGTFTSSHVNGALLSMPRAIVCGRIMPVASRAGLSSIRRLIGESDGTVGSCAAEAE